MVSAAPQADLIITNARVYTVDDKHPKAEAIAVLGDRIVGVGSARDINAWRGPNTKIIDAGGKLVLPGFNDSHVHFTSGGMQLTNVQLKDATSREEFIRRVAERANKTEAGEWILGGDWDDQQFTPATHTALIFSLEPVFAWVTSFLFLGERLGTRAGLGAFCILAGVLISEQKGSTESMAVSPDHAGVPSDIETQPNSGMEGR